MTASVTMAPERALTARQARFVSEYLVDGNASQAAIRAGYSPASAKVTASRLLAKVSVAAAVAEAQAELAERNKVTTDEVVAMLRCQYDAASARSQHAAAIRAAELLGKHIGAFTDRLEHAGPPVITVQIVRDGQSTDR